MLGKLLSMSKKKDAPELFVLNPFHAELGYVLF